MASRYASHVSTRETPQSRPIPGTPMVPNSAGGHTFAVDKWTRLERFLILGSAEGSYYASERKLTVESAEGVRACIAEDAARAVRTLVEISDAGRAPKNDPAIFALALVAGFESAPKVYPHAALAMEALPRVCRIGTHLFQFAEAVEKFRGWGKTLKNGVAAWYEGKDAQALAYQVVKYQRRDGWSHRDLLRLAHPRSADAAHQAVYRWVVGGKDVLGGREVKRGEAVAKYAAVAEALPAILGAFEAAKRATTPAEVVALIREHGLPRECVPTALLNKPEVWEALLDGMPMTAMLRNLAKMTAIGLLGPMSAARKTVCDRLGDEAAIRKARLHPLAVLLAARTYAGGRGLKGSLTWQPVSQVNDALDAAFSKAFGAVVPTGKRTLLALDVSGSMAVPIAGTSLTCREAAAAMAMVTARTEPAHQLVAFSAPKSSRPHLQRTPGGWVWKDRTVPLGGMHGGGDPELEPFDISACSRLTEVLAKTDAIPLGGTDCSLPMRAALAGRWEVDTFVILTDSETWAGPVHPVQALESYREKTGIPAKLIVAGMASNGFSIADPADAGMLDVVGFDASAPAIMADFSRG